MIQKNPLALAGTNFSSRLPRRIYLALRTLLRARELASDTASDPWDFGVEIASLMRHADRTDLRWLVKKGLLKHARETTQAHDAARAFLDEDSLKFSKWSCFILTDEGVVLARRLDNAEQKKPPAHPRWDGSRHELRVGDQLVKQFKLPSKNQEAVLAAFQEEGWPERIYDPLPPHPEINPKRRLHDTIKGLNRNQKAAVVHFQGDGTGEAILWKLSLVREPENDG